MSKDNVLVMDPPNTAPPMVEVWAFVSRDADGLENLIGMVMNNMGMQPLITGNGRILEMMREQVLQTRGALEATGKTIHLLHFTGREEIGF